MLRKRLMVVNGLTAEERPVLVSAGVTGREVLATLGLPTSYNLSLVRDRRVFRPEEDLFHAVQDRDRLYAFAPIEVGWPGRGHSSLFQRFVSFLFREGKEQPSNPCRLGGQMHSTVPRNVPAARRTRVARATQNLRHRPEGRGNGWQPCRPYWKVRGWRRVSQYEFVGFFKTPAGRIRGVCRFASRINYSFYLYDPPAGLLRGPHGACFSAIGRGKYSVHFATPPSDVNTAIYYLETLLTEAFRR